MSHSMVLIPQHTEKSILENYLLTPSTLPTLIPYSTFLNLVSSKKLRNDPNYASALRQAYRDFQFQRDIVLDQVRQNIEREYTIQAPILRTRLIRRIAAEEGDEETTGSKSRKRRRDAAEVDQDGKLEGQSDAEMEVKDEDLSSSDDEYTNPLHLTVQRTMYEHESNLHPAARSVAIDGDGGGHDEVAKKRIKLVSGSRYHTKQSLQRAMQNASKSLIEEIKDLETECARLTDELKETVGNLSDLRYGRRQSAENGSGDDFADVVEAIARFRNVVKSQKNTI